MFNFFIVTLLLFGCAHKPRVTTDWTKTIKTQNIVVRPGKVKLVEFNYIDSVKPMLYCSNGGEFPLFKLNGKYKTFLAESYFSTNKSFDCFVSDGKRQANIYKAKVREFPYKQERLYVNKRRVTLSKIDQKRVMEEQKMLNSIYAGFTKDPLFNQKFDTPLNSKITSYYGTRRVFNGHKKTQHLGTDYRARVGVKIKSVNRGKVVFAGNLFYTGNVVIVDHGASVFTVYGHLSKILAQQGELVSKGSVLGLSGKTGRVSGPHLHWGVKVAGQWVDGLSLVREGI
jgi:murein DD-endopeptidase MepM/ murein hydrolase activator NlpD